MDVEDHMKTSSWGQSKMAQAYRSNIQQKIESGNMRDAIAQEGWDVKRETGTKYNNALQEMIEYGKSKGFIPKQTIGKK
jgi:intergrase/recombinase